MRILLILWFFSEILGTIAWFGSSSIFLPLSLFFIDFQTALIVTAIYHIFGNASRLGLFFRHINIRILILFGLPSIVLTVLGASLADTVNTDLLKTILWWVLTLFACYALLKPTFTFGNHPLVGILWWAASGFSAGLIGTGWVLRWAFLQGFSLPKEQYIATIASIALIVDATRIPLYFGNGFLPPDKLVLIPFLFVVAFLGSHIGKYIVQKIPEQLWRRIILIAIMGMWLMFLIQPLLTN
jgi:uncharacterized membrane protein YfcA